MKDYIPDRSRSERMKKKMKRKRMKKVEKYEEKSWKGGKRRI